ncbi:MAG TPA: flagellar biosynthesis protein FlhB [Conexibacter sp.]|jgi:flagellar biosynthetic protein FlhB|nr:flagellar biosynthesis protein FlhB [Conexibacter sp.]
MADDKTERATPKRREEARRRGQVAKSTDLNGAVVLLASLLAISLLAPHTVAAAEGALRDGLANVAHPQQLMTGAGLGALFTSTIRSLLLGIAPVAGVCLAAGVLANVVQTGIKPSTHALKPDPKRLNPMTGARNVFGTRIFFETAKSLAKVSVVGVIVALALIPRLAELSATVGSNPAALGAMLSKMVFAIAQRAALAYLLIAAIDYAYQRWSREKSLRMTKEEVKEEFKQHSLPAEVKGALRRRQLQAARARMMAAVPQADVVVVNPTHFAVALKYDGTRPAPECVAKGQDLIALQIRRLAEEHDVPVVEDRPLARSLHAAMEIGQIVPEELYQAVAQVLAYVYRVARRRTA